MNLYAFELGRIKELALAEIETLFGEDSLEEIINNYAIVKTEHTLDQQTQDRMGGTIKIMKVTSQDKIVSTNPQELDQFFKEHVKKIFFDCLRTRDNSGKLLFAINLFNIPGKTNVLLKNLLIFSKKFLKAATISSRFINKPWQNTSSAQVYKSRILEKGMEISILLSPKTHTLYTTQTLSVQNPDKYSLRDYKKPFRDSHLGMLPPKLAQIMINLAEPAFDKPNGVIYDPFCGSGTVLMEGLLMGKESHGSDILDRMVQYATDNCSWLTEKLHLNNRTFKTHLKDATKLTSEEIPKNINAIITEGYLGKPLHNLIPKDQRDKIFGELRTLHSAWLSNIHKLLPKGTTIVMCITAFNTGRDVEHFPEFSKVANQAGFKALKRYTYSRDSQIIFRDIMILEAI